MAILVAIILIARHNIGNRNTSKSPPEDPPTSSPSATIDPSPPPGETSNLDISLPDPKVLTIDGSTSMVKLMKLLRNEYAQINPNVPTTYGFDKTGELTFGENAIPKGSSAGLKSLLIGKVQMAASSQVMSPEEAKAGIQLIPIARDAIAVVVGVDNPFKEGLTKEQLRKIYQGEIKNWSELGVPINLPIRVYNRQKDSGTRHFFKDNVLLGKKFASDDPPYFQTRQVDETTPVLNELGSDGIYYATVSQVRQQKIARVVPIDGGNPTDKTIISNKTYSLVRDLYLAVPKKTSLAVKGFVDLALSPKGQQLVKEADLIPIKDF